MTTETPQIMQSRIGKRPVPVPAGVDVKVAGSKVTIKGPKGTLERVFPDEVSISVADSLITITPKVGSGVRGKKFHGMTRSLLNGMVEGAAKGFNISLDLVGVGYRCEVSGKEMKMALGLSHPVHYTLPESVTARVETIDEGGIKKPRVHLASYDKETLGRVAARLKSFRPPEPYKGKGVRYTGEKIREKAGKAGGKK
jgi:large subunit ribosomal protein L6